TTRRRATAPRQRAPKGGGGSGLRARRCDSAAAAPPTPSRPSSWACQRHPALRRPWTGPSSGVEGRRAPSGGVADKASGPIAFAWPCVLSFVVVEERPQPVFEPDQIRQAPDEQGVLGSGPTPQALQRGADDVRLHESPARGGRAGMEALDQAVPLLGEPVVHEIGEIGFRVPP